MFFLSRSSSTGIDLKLFPAFGRIWLFFPFSNSFETTIALKLFLASDEMCFFDGTDGILTVLPKSSNFGSLLQV